MLATEITHLTDRPAWTQRIAAMSWQAARIIWRTLDSDFEDVGTPRCPTDDQEKRLQLMFSAGF
jgi:hypothetical protein